MVLDGAFANNRTPELGTPPFVFPLFFSCNYTAHLHVLKFDSDILFLLSVCMCVFMCVCAYMLVAYFLIFCFYSFNEFTPG